MAFIGSDGYDTQIRQLKSQIGAKDSELTSLRNEQRKGVEELVQARKLREEAEYKAQLEADRATKAEKLLETKTKDVAQLRLQRDNLDSTVQALNDKVKTAEKENSRLQYHADFAAGGSTAVDQKALDERKKLDTKVKALEQELRRSEDEVHALRSGKLNSGKSTQFLDPSSPKGKQNGNRRRSTSLSSSNRIQDLEAEIESLRNSSSSSLDLDKLKSQLNNAKRDLDKVTNAKLALEKSTKKEIDELNSRLEDANFELEDRRREGGGAGPSKEIENGKKEIVSLNGQIQKLAHELQVKTTHITSLERKLVELDHLQSALAEERRQRADLENAAAVPLPASPNPDFLEKIAQLESQLSEARSLPSATTSTNPSLPAAAQIRRLERELEKIRRELATAEDEIEKLDIENLALKANKALPGSPSSRSITLPAVADARVLELEETVEELEKAMAQGGADAEDMEGLRSLLRNTEYELEMARGELQQEKNRSHQLDMQIQECKNSLEQQREIVATSCKDILNLQVALQEAQSSLSVSDDTIQQLQVQLDESHERVKDTTQLLQDAERQQSDLHSQLSVQQQKSADTAPLQEKLAETEELLRGLRVQLSDSVRQRAELEVVELELKEERNSARSDVARLHEELLALQRSGKETEKQLATEISASEEKIRHEIDSRKLAQAEVDVLQIRLLDAEKNLSSVGAIVDDLQVKLEEAMTEKLRVDDELRHAQEDIGNRSTESDARARDEELLDVKEELESLRASLASVKTEMHGALFVKDKDIEEAIATIARLKSTIHDLEQASRKAESRHVNLLHDKIGRLRSERDELRVSLNFIQHEHRFARQALEPDRTIAVADLEDVNKVVREKTDSLEKALADLSKIAKLEDDLRDAITARDELLMQQSIHRDAIKANQSQLRENAVELGTMASHLAHSKHAASMAQSENVQLSRTVKELEKKLDGLMEGKHTLSTLDADLGDRPGSRAGSIRAGSAMGHYATGGVETAALKVQVVDLQEKIVRRDAEIARDKNELRRLKTTTRLAEDASRENQSELEVANHRIIQLDVQLRAARRGAEQANDDVQNLSASVSRLDEEVRTTRIERDVSTRENVVVVRGLVVGLAMQKKGLKEVRQKWRVAEAGLEGSRGSVAILESRLKESNEAAIKANEFVEVSATHLAEVEKQLAETSASIARLEAELSSVNAKLAVSESERQQAAESAISERHAFKSEVSELQVSRQTAQSRIAVLETDTADLLDKLSAGERMRVEFNIASEREIAIHVAKISSLESLLSHAEEARAGLVAEVAALVESLGDADQTHADEMSSAGSREAEVVARAESLARDVEARVAEVDGLKLRVEAVQVELDGVVGNLASRDQSIREMDATINNLRQSMHDTQAKLDISLQTASILETRLAEAQQAISSLNSEVIQLKIAHDAKIRAVEDMKAEVETAERRNGDALQSSKKVERLEEQVRSGIELLRQKEVELSSMSASLAAAESDMFVARDEVSSGKRDLREQGMEVTRLQAEIAELQITAAARQQTEVDEVVLVMVSSLQQEIADLTEQVQGLEDTLTKKVAEVDEAEDRVREAFKDISRLRKKNEKLERQKAAAETAANTAINKPVAPPSSTTIPTTLSVATPRVASSPRPPLRQVNVFEPQSQSTTPQSVGVKRHREMDEDSGEKLPAECILLPPTAPPSARKAGRGFVPSRGMYNGGAVGIGRENTFGLPSTPSVRNIFATD